VCRLAVGEMRERESAAGIKCLICGKLVLEALKIIQYQYVSKNRIFDNIALRLLFQMPF